MRGLTIKLISFMKLFYFLLALFLFVNCPADAQINYSILPTHPRTKMWKIVGIDNDGYSHRHDIGQVFKTDTVINSTKYMIFDTGTPESCFFREEEGKVYRYDKTIETEYMIYDFTLSVGDVFQCHDGTEMQVAEKSLSKDYTSCESNPDRIVLRLINTSNSHDGDIWMEGVGSVFTGLFSKADFNEKRCFVISMSNWYDTADNPDYAYFYINKEDYKLVWAQSERLTTQEDFDGCLDFEINKKNFNLEFIGDTLHVRGYALLHSELFALQASIIKDYIILSILEGSSYSMHKGTYYKFDVKIPDFLTGTYHIQYENREEVIISCNSTPGDINSDGTVNINDVVCIINHMAGAASWSKADVNGDKMTDINDVVSVINIMAASAP